jgi:hypothetical protein
MEPEFRKAAIPGDFPIRCLRGQPDEHEFVDCCPYVEALRKQEHAGAVISRVPKRTKMCGHGSDIVRHEDAAIHADAAYRLMGEMGWRYQVYKNGLAWAALCARPLDSTVTSES